MNLHKKCKKRSRASTSPKRNFCNNNCSQTLLLNMCQNAQPSSRTNASIASAKACTIVMLFLVLSNLPSASSLMSHDATSSSMPSLRLTANRKIIHMNTKKNRKRILATIGSSVTLPLSSSQSNKISSTKMHMINYVQLFTDSDTSQDESIENSRWLSWMTGGTPRGVADVKMRDPVELGGVPRSDRYASRDWLHNTINLANSAILKDIAFPVCFMTFWGTGISLIHKKLLSLGRREAAMNMCIPVQPHSLMVSALGLLLVFRTNSAYQRFAEGRKIWEDILSVARDLSRLAKLYEPQIGTAKVRRVNKLLAAFPYLLRFRIRPNSIMRKLDDPDVKRDPETSLILYQDHGTYILFFSGKDNV